MRMAGCWRKQEERTDHHFVREVGSLWRQLLARELGPIGRKAHGSIRGDPSIARTQNYYQKTKD